MQTLFQDLRYGARQLLKRPGFTFLAIISMALGIGANTAIFSLVDTVAFRPLPVKNASELQELYGTLHNGADYTLQSWLNYKDYRDRNQVFSGLIAYRIVVASLSHNGNNERVWGTLVSANYFDVLGVPLLLGRGFRPEENETPKSHPVVVLSYGAWQKRFGADPAIVGRTVSLNNVPFTVVGVARKGFIGTEVAYSPEIWAPLMMAPVIEPGSTYLDNRDSDNSFVVGRLKPGVTKNQAQAALKILTLEMAKENPKDNEGRGIELIPPGLFIPDIRNAVLTFAAVLTVVGTLVLLLACVNLANLLLARATERRKEIAIRLAVGASRARLIRQLLTESVTLSLLGGAGGVILAAWINHLVRTIKLPTDVALMFDLRVDWRVLSFTLLLSLLTGVLFSLIPALQSSKPELVPALKDETSMAGFRRSRLRNGLVVLQVALSLVLLICAGLIVRSLQEAQRMRPGFNPENAVAVSFDVGLQGYDETRGRAFQKQALERIRALPGIESAALTDNIPLSLNYNSTSIYLEGQPPAASAQLPPAIPASVTPHYFRTMGIALRGRDFTEQEDKKENRVAIVNETFAKKFFPGQEAIGKRFNFSGPENPLWEIIGVCGDGKYNSLGEEPKAAIFRPQLRDYSTGVALVARTARDTRSTLAAIQREMRSLDPTLPLYEVKTLTEHMKIPLFPARMAAGALGSFGILALVLAAVGIYGVMSYVVAGRTREIGLRMALGARGANVRRLILRQGMTLALIGSGIGLLIAFLATRLLKTVLYGVSAVDATTFIGVTLLLGTVALLACWIPALRASRVDPMVALRAE
ncbi:MAG TPA: ABC transporter permease [Chthoniobacterales bacterium]|nr:ABC transporter permease [Chthoniobacterales bacterium]